MANPLFKTRIWVRQELLSRLADITDTADTNITKTIDIILEDYITTQELKQLLKDKTNE